MSILQSTQFDLIHLQLLLPDGQRLSIKRIFEEINIFENVFMPCTSGNIVVRDGIGLASKVNFDGSEKIRIEVTKDWDSRNEVDSSGIPISPVYARTFVIYKKTDRKQLTQNSEVYTLHFISEEFLLSQQKVVNQSFTGTYTDIVRIVLKDYLNIDTNIFGQVANIYETKGIHNIRGNGMKPIELIEYVTKRASSNEGVPDFMFWQTVNGFNFMPVSTIMSMDPKMDIFFGAKNVNENVTLEMYGARDFRIISQFNSAENISSGVYAGTFIGFDPLTRSITKTKLNFDDVYKLSTHANKSGINAKITYDSKNKSLATDMYDSRITLYPFQSERMKNNYLREKDTKTANIIDDSHNYVLQRKAIFANLMQKRIRIVMPGNFNFLAGDFVNVHFPKQYNQTDADSGGDKSLYGYYMISGVRHIMRFDKHETILEVVTDSTNYGS